MKIKRSNKKTKRYILTVGSIILLGLVALLAYLLLIRPLLDAPSGTDQPVGAGQAEQQTDNQNVSPEDKQAAPNTDTPSTPQVDDGTAKMQVQLVSSVNQSNGTIFIRGGINYPVGGGICYAKLSGPSGQSIQKESTVLQNPASTDCKTISIPVSELAPGKWTYTLNYTSAKYEGTSDEVSFSV